MEIRTKQFNLTEKQFRHILISEHFKVVKPIIILFTAMALLSVLFGFDGLLLISVLMDAIYISIPFLATNNIKNTQNRLNFVNRYAEIDDEFFSLFYDDGSLVKVKFDNLKKILKSSNYYLFCTQHDVFYIPNFYCLPKAAFYWEKDINEFELLLKDKKLLFN